MIIRQAKLKGWQEDGMLYSPVGSIQAMRAELSTLDHRTECARKKTELLITWLRNVTIMAAITMLIGLVLCALCLLVSYTNTIL